MAPPWRISVVGTSGSGKTTFASTLVKRLHIPHTELDQLHWLPNWTPRELEDFQRQVDAVTTGEQWVIDGNYSKVRDRIWQQANLVVWLDYPRWIVMGRLLQRTAHRLLTQQELWSGNRENLHTALLDQDAILFWAWRTHGKHRRTYPAQFAKPEYGHLSVVRLRSPQEAEHWLDSFSTKV